MINIKTNRMQKLMLVSRTLVLLCLVAVVALPAAAAAGLSGQPVCVTTSTSNWQASYMPDPAQPPDANACIRALHDGRAAVRLPVAAAGTSDSKPETLWGYLDRNGNLVIEPQFDEVRAFHHGLAAVRVDGQWGYIERDGKWAIEPRFDKAQPFTASRLALVRERGVRKLIKRDGSVIRTFTPTVKSVTLYDGAPLGVYVSYRSRWLTLDGKKITAPEGVDYAAYPLNDHMLVARDKSGQYGIIKTQGRWVVEPEYDYIDREGGLVKLEGDNGDILVNIHGEVVTPDSINRMVRRGDYWLLHDSKKSQWTLLNADGEVVKVFAGASVPDSFQSLGKFVVWRSADQRWHAALPRQADSFDAPRGWYPVRSRYGDDDVLLWTRGQSHAIKGILFSDGRLIDDGIWLLNVARVTTGDGRTVFRTENDQILNISNAQGELLLNNDEARIVSRYQVELLPSSARYGNGSDPVAIAILQPGRDEPTDTASLLLSDGSIRSNPEWQSIDDVSGSADVQRFAVETGSGIGLINAAGDMLLPAKQASIQPFGDHYAMAYGPIGAHIVDLNGNLHAAPKYFLMQPVGAGRLRFRETAAGGLPWGLYDVANERVISEPAYDSIGSFHNGYAPASNKDGAFGVINTSGEWVIPARYTAVTHLVGGLWQVRTTPVDSYSDVKQGVVTVAGRTIVPVTTGVSISRMDSGHVKISTANALGSGLNRSTWLFDTRGELVLGGAGESLDFDNGWWQIKQLPVLGYMSAQGTWVIEPSVSTGSAFHAGANGHAYALHSFGHKQVIINAQGETVATLEHDGWFWPDDSPWLLRYSRTDDDGMPETMFASPDGQVRLTVDAPAGQFAGDYALVRRENGYDMSYQRIDRQGRTLSRYWHEVLGLPSDGLLFVREKGLYGYMDTQGRYVIAPVFSAATPFSDGRAVVSSPYASMIIDNKARPLAMVAVKCGRRVLFNADNQRVWPEQLPSQCQPSR